MGSHKIDLMSHFADVTPYFLDLNRGRLPSSSINVTDTPATRPETTRRSWTGERHESSRLNFHHQASARINFYAHLMTPTPFLLVCLTTSNRIAFKQVDLGCIKGIYLPQEYTPLHSLLAHSLLLQSPTHHQHHGICEIDLNTVLRAVWRSVGKP